MSLDVGLIGAGNISNAHLPAYRDHPEDVRLAGVCDAREDRAAEVAAEFDIDYWTDYETFVAEADVEAVDVVLPHDLHYPVVKAALEAGKHVHVEKPFAVSMDECRELVALADDRDRTLMVGQMQRYHPAYQAVKETVDDGDLGQIHHARIDAFQNLPSALPPPHWLYDGEKAGGGVTISVLVHKIDLLRYFLGDVRRAIALGKTTHEAFEDAEDYCTGLLEFENGTMVDLFNTYSAAGAPYDELFWLLGDDGAIHALPEDPDAEPYIGMSQPKIRYRDDEGSLKSFTPIDPAPEAVGLRTENAFVNELLHFAECVESGQEPLSSGRDNLGTMATIFAIYESMDADGEPVLVDEVLGAHDGENA